MNIYRLLQLNRIIKNHRIKFLGMYILHKLNMRYLAVNLDPVLACNLRCKMCYFTDKDFVKTLKGQFKEEELEQVAKAIFNRALKLQVGCGTEPTLFKQLPKIIKLGKEHKVPYISMTTNANLLTEENVRELLEAGLNEFTISLHGVTKEAYENFMQKASYEKFHRALDAFAKLKNEFDFKVRINYTFNKDNFHELKDFFKYYKGESFDILQLRPIQKIGNTEYNDFDISSLCEDYEKLIPSIKNSCKENNITLLAPNSIRNLNAKNKSSYVFDFAFCYVSPKHFWKEGFDYKNQSFNAFAKQIGWGKLLFNNIFKSQKKLSTTSNKLNYDIELY